MTRRGSIGDMDWRAHMYRGGGDLGPVEWLRGGAWGLLAVAKGGGRGEFKS
jgi:hypothetical protein